MKPISYLDLALIVPCRADTTTGLTDDSFSLLWPLNFPWLSKEKASTNKLALKVNSFRLGPVEVGRKSYTSPPSKCFPSSTLLSRHRNGSIPVHTEWLRRAWRQRWHLRELQLISGRLKVVSWIASGERRSCKTSPSLTKQNEESGKQVFHSRG